MPQAYWIIPLESGGRPDNTLPQPPLGIWGGGNMPYPDQGLPGGQGGRPSQPIYHPGHPDHGLPAFPSHPIAPGGPSGGYPSHPIYHPGHPDHGLPAYPDQGLPGLPPGTPTHPIELPEPFPPPPPEYADKYIAAVWSPQSESWTVSVAEVTPTPHA